MKLVYKILELLHQSEDSIEYTKLLKSSLGVEPYDILETLEYMKNEGLISGNLQSGELVHLTSKGKVKLTAYNEDLEDKVNQRNEYIANRRSDRRFQVISAIITGTIVAVISAIINIIINASGS